MQRRTMLFGVAAAAAAAAAPSTAWNNRFAEQLRDDFLAHWKVETQYSLDVLDAMPSEHFDLKPTPDQRSFMDQIGHYVQSNVNYFKKFELPVEPPPAPTEATPQTLRSFLIASYDYVAEVLATMTEEDFSRRDIRFRPSGPDTPHTAQDIFMRAYMHSAHHRGSVVVYLRLAGVEPPRWRFSAQGLA
ncbi:MAG: DinB family protein [Bryobacterales bacterium]|nr:DinB family protein [Bryobacterales bacterium]MDE0264806.1 DinB family protein [Bryobacterales bacterium]